MKRLAIIATHPVQYNVPWFRRLACEPGIEVCVFYTWHADGQAKYDPEFQQDIAWDIPLLEGYDYSLVSPQPTVTQKNFWRLKNDITRPIEAWGADGVLVIGWNYLSHLQAMRYFSGKIPVFFRGDSTLLDQRSPLRSRIRKYFLRMVYSYVDAAFFVGANNYDYFQQHGMSDLQLTYAPHVVDNRRFSNNAEAHEEEARRWRTSLGIPQESVVFLFVGKLIDLKSPLLLLQAFQKLPHDHKPHLVYVGNGDCESTLRAQAADADNIHFIPFQNQSRMPVVYRLGDVVCLPSESETWGLVVNEAMASGRPVIVSDKVGCARDLVANQETGFIHKSQCQFSLLHAMKKCQNRDELASKGRGCTEFIDAWSCEKLAKQIKDRFLSAA